MDETPAKRSTKQLTKTGKRRRRQQRSTDTQQKILEAAAEECALHGFIGTSTRVVAARAGVQHPALTYHFGNKDGLWRATMRGLNESVLTTLKARLQALRGVDKITTLRLVMEDFIRFSAANPKFHRLMDHEAGNGGERMSWLVDEFVKEFFKLLVPLIEAAQKDGGFLSRGPPHLGYFVTRHCPPLLLPAPQLTKHS